MTEAAPIKSVELTAIVAAYVGSTNPVALKAYEKLERYIQAKFPDAVIRRVFTSERALKKVADNNFDADSLAGALEKLAVEGHKRVGVLPCMTFAGDNCMNMMPVMMVFGEVFADGVSLFRVLIDWELDCRVFAKTLLEELAGKIESNDALVLVAHSPHPMLEIFETQFKQQYEPVYITTLGDEEYLDRLCAKLKQDGRKKVLLHPLMIAGGNHINRDIGGIIGGQLTAEGFDCTAVLKGLCEYDSVCELLTSHIIPG